MPRLVKPIRDRVSFVIKTSDPTVLDTNYPVPCLWINEAAGNTFIHYGSGVWDRQTSSAGAQSRKISTPNLTGNAYTIADDDYTVLINDADVQVTGTVVVALPLVADSSGRILNIKKMANSYIVQLKGHGAENIDGTNTKNITVKNNAITIHCDDVKWNII